MRIFYFANALLEKIFTREFYVENQVFCALLGLTESPSSLAESPSGLVVKLVGLAESPSSLTESPLGLVVKLVCLVVKLVCLAENLFGPR